MQTDTLTAACHGKLPTHGDFVRHRATTPAVRAFDEWVQKGLYQARQQRRRELEAVYDDAPAIRFVFNAQGGTHPLLGTMKPSRDRSGRTYPFTVSVEAAHALDADGLRYAPVQARALFDDADQIVQAATAGTLSHRDVIDRVRQLEPSLSVSATRPSAYDRYLQEQTMASFWTQLFGHFGDGRKYRLIDNMLTILNPLRGRPATPLAYGLQFPLGSEESSTYNVCFWLELCMQLLDHPSVEPTIFWQEEAPQASASPFLLLFMQPPRPRVFFQLLNATAEDDNICNLARMGDQSGAEAALSIPTQYGEMLEDETLSLHDFLHRLA